MSYWATRKTWPRGRSCQDKSGIRSYWFRSVFWSENDRKRLADEIQQEEAYRRWHEQRMVQEMCSHEKVTPYPEGGWSCIDCKLWMWVWPKPFSVDFEKIAPYMEY